MVDGKVALITGASGSIGSSVARKLAAHGASVVINYNTGERKARNLVREITGNGGSAIALHADVRSVAAVEDMARETFDRFGSIDILVNNAGIVRDRLLVTMKNSDWRDVIDVNLTGPVNCCKAVVPYMKNRNYGRIVNVGSITGLTAQKMRANYGAAKRALVGVTKSLGRELAGKNIRVNAVAPQVVKGGVSRSASIWELRTLKKYTPVGKLADPEDVAHAVLFLSGENIGFITGTVLNLTGGLITWQI